MSSVFSDAGAPLPSGCGAKACGTLWLGQTYYRKSCSHDVGVCVDGHWEFWPTLCVADLAPCTSASFARRCVADDRGRLGVIVIGNSYVVANDGWATSRSPSGGPFQGTLSNADQVRCAEAMAAAGPDLRACGDAGRITDAYNERYPDGGPAEHDAAQRCP